MDDAIHIQIEIVHLFAIRVGLCSVDRDRFPVDLFRSLLDDRRDDLWILLR